MFSKTLECWLNCFIFYFHFLTEMYYFSLSQECYSLGYSTLVYIDNSECLTRFILEVRVVHHVIMNIFMDTYQNQFSFRNL